MINKKHTRKVILQAGPNQHQRQSDTETDPVVSRLED